MSGSYTTISNVFQSGKTEDILKTVGDVRDRIEIVHTRDFGNFLARLFPHFRDVLAKTPIQMKASVSLDLDR